jgi:putative transposase
MDWFARRILAWRLRTRWRLRSVSTPSRRHLQNTAARKSNTDQGSQFTSADFTGVLSRNAIAISMDGKGNVFVERFWRTIKYEEVYLHAYDSVGEARQAIGGYLDFYNARRPHAALKHSAEKNTGMMWNFGTDQFRRLQLWSWSRT